MERAKEALRVCPTILIRPRLEEYIEALEAVVFSIGRRVGYHLADCEELAERIAELMMRQGAIDEIAARVYKLEQGGTHAAPNS